MNSKEIAQTIYNQLGGKRFLFTTGTKNLVYGKNWLQMHLIKNKSHAKYLKIELLPSDTYRMVFSSLDKQDNLVIKAEFENVYCDQLQTIFEETTGLKINIF